jgi:hypothetical protein
MFLYMANQTKINDEIVHRRLTDLYRLPGFQTLARVTPHTIRPDALVVHLRRLKKNRDMFLLQSDNTAAA